ncbi:MAG: type IV-A pilus assembly ATPase PilB [Gammaproteobacteria bacterium]
MAATGHLATLSGLPRRLVKDGLIDESGALDALSKSRAEDVGFVSYLIANNLADAGAISAAASHEFGVPSMDLDAFEIDTEVVSVVREQLIRKHRVLPLVRRGKKLYIAVSDPTNLQALDDIRFQTGFGTEAVVVEDDKLEEMVKKAIESVDTSMASLTSHDDFDLESLENLDISGGDQEFDEVTREDVDDAPIVRFVNKILLDAINQGCSDIHFEPYEMFFRIRTRRDGILHQVAQPPVVLAAKISARIKVMSRLDIAERRVPQDGRIKMRLSKKRAIDFRVSTCPTLYGEKIVMRILDPSSAKLGIDALGYEEQQKQLYVNALNQPYGMILVTGPTGSGKTVSLYTGLNILNTDDRNISTAEDPAEINLPGINQVNVNPKVGLTFASALRAFLRQDPDVIMVGEIRDLETADIAIKAAQTGHLVLSTLHTNDAPKTLTRMVDMGVKPYAIASSVSLIIAQRLARRLCGNCKQPLDIPKETLIQEGFSEQEAGSGKLQLMTPVGCKQCMHGYKGRIGIFQVMAVSATMGRIIMEGGNSMHLAEQAVKEGVADLRAAGLNKVREGTTSLEEVNRVTTD